MMATLFSRQLLSALSFLISGLGKIIATLRQDPGVIFC